MQEHIATAHGCQPSMTNMKSACYLVIRVAVCVLVATTPPVRCSASVMHEVMLNDSQPTVSLDSFLEYIFCLQVNVSHTLPYSCYWIINNTEATNERYRSHVEYVDEFSLRLQPFGQYFYNTICSCLFLETGDMYTVAIGGSGTYNDCMEFRVKGKNTWESDHPLWRDGYCYTHNSDVLTLSGLIIVGQLTILSLL